MLSRGDLPKLEARLFRPELGGGSVLLFLDCFLPVYLVGETVRPVLAENLDDGLHVRALAVDGDVDFPFEGVEIAGQCCLRELAPLRLGKSAVETERPEILGDGFPLHPLLGRRRVLRSRFHRGELGDFRHIILLNNGDDKE